jgi:geranylgeranyl transferase type-1 subunit beta
MEARAFSTRLHIGYAKAVLSQPLPFSAVASDSSRIALVYFSLLSLDVCDALTSAFSAERRGALVSWLYSCMIPDIGGFCGGPASAGDCAARSWSVPMTYAAVASLIMLGDDCARIDRAALSRALASLQADVGSVVSSPLSRGDGDVRFVFSASATATLLALPFSALETRSALDFIAACQTHEGGLALQPGGEAHGGATFCGLAARSLLLSRAPRDEGHPRESSMDVPAALRWLARRQDSQSGGPTGRAGKEPDACYAFWLGASAAILLKEVATPELTVADASSLRAWVARCAASEGPGLAREPGEDADPFHTAYALAGLAIAGEPALRCVDAELGLTQATKKLWGSQQHINL